MNQENTPPGWYMDPANSNMQRYWDGFNWTSETRMPVPGGPPGAPGSTDSGYPSYGQGDTSNGGAGFSSPVNNTYPNNPMQGVTSDRPDNYLVWAILATVLCCWPLGIPSIVYAAKVNSLWDQGKKEESVNASKQAKKWAIISAIAGGVIVVGYVLLVGVGVALSGS